VQAFCRGLYPILIEGDTNAFRRYLARWEDLVGDTAELADAPAEQQRQTMAALLRYPQRFNLPPWPARDGVHGARPTDDAGRLAARRRVEEARRDPARPRAWPAAPEHRAPAADDQRRSAAPHDAPDVREAAVAGSGEASTASSGGVAGTYQLDMLTGEFVPVPLCAAPEGGRVIREAPPAELESSKPSRPRPRRPRRRAATHGLAQLTLWPASAALRAGDDSHARN
jgi:hypothetical protein